MGEAAEGDEADGQAERREASEEATAGSEEWWDAAAAARASFPLLGRLVMG